MRIPTIRGIIDRRMLVNFVIDSEVAKRIVPAPFTPKLINGKAIAGICLIRLKEVRIKGFPAFLGFRSENGAHRIAVEWLKNDIIKEGVYIPRRDTSSRFNTLVGGRLFPGKHYYAKFDVSEQGNNYHIAFTSSDDTTISVDASVTDKFNPDSVFKNLKTASDFFKTGALGYSPNNNKFDGLLLNTYKWEVHPLTVSKVVSSFFENRDIFPEGSVQFDNALLMVNVEHEWTSVTEKSFV
ncbi:MAG: hypothetical protein JWQ79_2948 [Mucilaginibacter sp.]|nr:hypothetical protein [Mucilaginibacter sp.]